MNNNEFKVDPTVVIEHYSQELSKVQNELIMYKALAEGYKNDLDEIKDRPTLDEEE